MTKNVNEFITQLREDADGWEAEAAKYKGRTHFSYGGVALFYRAAADYIEAGLESYREGYEDGMKDARAEGIEYR